LAALAALCAAWESRPGSTDTILAAPDIIRAVEADAVARAQFRHRTGRDPTLHAESPVDRRMLRWRLVTNL
jgi:hypothetical protein